MDGPAANGGRTAGGARRGRQDDWPERDRLILSNGHITPIRYATMAHAGYFPLAELKTLRKFGSRLQGHPHREYMPWLETSSGPLGSGLSQAVGMALADRIDRGAGTDKTIYALLSDGEHDEGNTWEAIMLASKEKLSNFKGYIFQISFLHKALRDGFVIGK